VFDQGDGGTGPVVFAQGEGGTGPVVLAANHGDGGTGPVVFASVEWVVKALTPIALVRTNKTNTTRINHLLIDPSEYRNNYAGESISG
jgi:hypothetical protein